MPPQTGVCAAWTTVDAAAGCKPCLGVTIAPAVLTEAVNVASDLLYELSGQRFPGECETTVRPMGKAGALEGPSRRAVLGSSSGDSGYSVLWGACSCSYHEDGRFGGAGWGPDELTLGAYPINSITTVKVDGATVPSSKYAVYDRRWLNRIDGISWPCSQDLAKADTELNTFSVKFKHGASPPYAGVLAAKRLACEIAMACAGADCGLPERVTTVARQGITMTVLDPQDFLDHGRTGLYEVDLFLKTYNPNNLRGEATVGSPDIGWPVRRLT